MNYAKIKYCDIANGPGVRTSLFVSGCTHHCKNCFNPETWDFKYGEDFTPQVEDELIKSCDPSYITGLTLLGGEPMEPSNQRTLLPFLKRFKKAHPDKTVWCYTGFTYEELAGKVENRCRCEITDELFSIIDVLVDGEYVDDLHDVALRFRGSSNQRIIDMKKTVETEAVVPWQDDPIFATHKFDDK